MHETSEAAQDDAAENDAILARQCTELAWKIVGGPDRPSAEDVAAQIKKLCEQWADGERECCALIAEEHSAVAAMAIRGQLQEAHPIERRIATDTIELERTKQRFKDEIAKRELGID